jgi:histidinol dehydrogenase
MPEMLKQYTFTDLSSAETKALLKRPKMDFEAIFKNVLPVIDRVAEQGDQAVIHWNTQFDGQSADPIVCSPATEDATLSVAVQQAIDVAFTNIEQFHRAQQQSVLQVETMPGVTCEKHTRAIESVGLYVPGGTATLPSTAMMLAIPAMIAGCPTRVLASPPGADSKLAPEIVYIARKAGVTHLLKAGGAQAIAAMAYGTQSVPKVDKLFGPGNQYVTAAKMLVQQSEAQVSIDMPAGPSEVLIIADGQARPDFVAADLLSQAEHGADSQVVLLFTPDFAVEELTRQLETQLKQLPRMDLATKALQNSFALACPDVSTALNFSNQYAPEHLIINVAEPEKTLPSIQHAGSVFLGAYTPESVGDYASGTNHTLPTYGYARMYSGVHLASFQKSMTVQQLSTTGLQHVGPSVEILAEREGLQAHKNAVSIRLKHLSSTHE